MQPITCGKLQKNDDYGKDIKKLGEGAYGKVILKDGGKYGIPVAVKQFDLLYEGSIKASFIRETSLLLTLDHPNIVRLLDVNMEDEGHLASRGVKLSDMTKPTVSLVEDERGTSLYNKKFTEDEFRPLLMQLFAALSYIHSFGIYHRDLKPGNILVNTDNHLTLIDFGISRQTTIEDSNFTSRVYTGGYRAPEVIQEKRYTEKADIWAAGIVWIETLVGRKQQKLLLDRETPKESLIAVRELVDKLGEIIPNFSRSGLSLLRKVLSLNSEARPTADEILQDPYFERRPLKLFKETQMTGFDWYVNSCYIDSLLMVMFFSDTEFFRDGVLAFDPYSIRDQYRGEFCEESAGEIRDIPGYVKKIQDQIRIDLQNLHSGKAQHSCTPLRKLLLSCLPSMKKDKNWEVFSVRELYAAFVAMFPRLQMMAPSQRIYKTEPPGPIEDRLYRVFTMWDFMDTHLNVEGDYINILWEKINCPLLVFTNSLTPRIQKFNKLGVESGVHKINHEKFPWKAEKGRKFGEFILGGKYELIGVITITGVQKGAEGGSHYVCYFKTSDGDWNYYNDLKNYAVSIEKLPKEGVWVEKNGKVPEMYFYRRLKGAINPLDYFRHYLTRLEALKSRSFRIKISSDEKIHALRNHQINYLKQDCENLSLARVTYFLTVKILDMFIQYRRERFIEIPNTIATACLSLAVKFYEIKVITVNYLEEYSNKKTRSRKIADSELEIYQVLCQNINFATAYDYFLYFHGKEEDLPILYCLLRSNIIYRKSDLHIGRNVAQKRLSKDELKAFQDAYIPEIDNILLDTEFDAYDILK